MRDYKLGVIGDPIEHSLSPKIHELFSKQTNKFFIDYQAYRVEPKDLDSFIKDFFKNGGHGLNVTLPHKEACLKSVWGAMGYSRFIGAANTLVGSGASDGHKIKAYSTDGKGLVDDLDGKCNLQSANVLILGAGGAALSIILDIQDKEAANIAIDNRTREKIQPILEKFSTHGTLLSPSGLPKTKIVDLDDFSGEIDLVINATSAGFSGSFNWDRELATRERTIFYDLSYTHNEEKTPFLKWASKYSDNCYDGFGMLINQAAYSFELWTALKPGTNISKLDLVDD